MITLLAIMALAFLFSSSLDQSTSRALANKTKADFAARSAVNTAITRLTDNLSNYPDSATTWETVNQAGGATVQYQGTTLYYREQTPEATATGTPSPLHALPLISGAQAVLIPYGAQPPAARETTLRAALPVLDDTNSFDLNHARSANDTQGWIGAPPGAPSRPAFRGQWIEQKDSDGKVTSRFAYWVEDESFKANANLMGKIVRGATTLGNAPSQIPLQGLLKVVLPGSDADSLANDIFAERAQFPGSLFFEYRALNQTNSQPTIADTAKFEATIYSGASNLSRNGAKRVNLNRVVASSTDPVEIRTQLDQITKTIETCLPNFGQRFYRTGTNKNSLDVSGTGSPSNRTIYVNKIAANIRDYIDTDSQPTIINNNSGMTVRIGSPPTNAIITSGGGTAGPNEVIAIGKERVPLIQEYALRVREIAFSPRTGPFADYTISIDHYLEFWNTTNRDIVLSDLGPNPFLLIANQPGWDAGTLDSIPEGLPRDIRIPITGGITFPAGAVTVITTDATLLPALTPAGTRVYQVTIPANLRTYTGRTDKKSGSELRLNMIDRTTSSSDYETEIALGNDLGILESAWGAGAISSAISVNIDITNPPENRLDDTKYHFRGASLRGNSGATAPNATTGDPRTNAEQLRFDLNGASAGNDKTRYFSSGLNNNNIPGTCPSCSTFGAPNSYFVIPANWPDYSSSTQSATAAPAVIANANLTSIGQLGDIFDPVRTRGDATGVDSDGVSMNIKLSRSGGRTLKIGQADRNDPATNPNGLWDGNSNTASREWTAWRLLDVFSTSDSVQLDGRININGINRDNGTALKAAFYGYIFQPVPDTDPNLAGRPFDADPSDPTDKINVLISQLQARLNNDQALFNNAFLNTSGPLAERGELSEMPIFNTGSDLAAGVNTPTTNDRGREELFRRLVELTTTRGSIFTVYAVGQSLIPPQPGGTVPIITSTSQIKVTFRIDPVWNGGTPTDPFDPSAVTNRLRKPDKYAIKVLYAGE
jgi:hypothetical protein